MSLTVGKEKKFYSKLHHKPNNERETPKLELPVAHRDLDLMSPKAWKE